MVDPVKWLDRHGDVLWRFAASRVRDAAVIEELVQDTLSASWQSRASFRGEATEQTWLISILRRKIADHFRSQRRTRSGQVRSFNDLFTPNGKWAAAPEPWAKVSLDQSTNEAFWAALRTCIDKLPATLADTFIMLDVRGVTSAAVRAALGITEQNLWVRTHRARNLMRECLTPVLGPSGKRGPKGGT